MSYPDILSGKFGGGVVFFVMKILSNSTLRLTTARRTLLTPIAFAVVLAFRGQLERIELC